MTSTHTPTAEPTDKPRRMRPTLRQQMVLLATVPAGLAMLLLLLVAALAWQRGAAAIASLAAVLAAGMLGVLLASLWAARRILQSGVRRASRALDQSQRLMQSHIDQATAELARKNRQLELASQAKTRLLAAASHDLRQPLHALTLFSDSLADGETDPARLTRISHIRACVESLDRLFSELLNLSQLDAGVLRPQWTDFPLDQLFDDVSRNFRPVAEQKELRLVVRKTDTWVRSDYIMLTRILSNLISNSIRHTQCGGVLVAVRGHGRALRVEVWDSGEGIAPEHQARVFEEFYQVESPGSPRTQGMGLGLFTVRRLADLLNMHLELLSRPGHGTLVRITVRATVPRGQLGTAAIPPPDELRLDHMTVLIMDDERTILEGMQLVLSRWGARVMTAASRDELLALADQWSVVPDVIISDLLLQGTDNGLDLLAVLQRHPRGIGAQTALLLVTGETNAQELGRALVLGIPVLHKPVPPEKLRQAILAQLLHVRGRAWHAP